MLPDMPKLESPFVRKMNEKNEYLVTNEINPWNKNTAHKINIIQFIPYFSLPSKEKGVNEGYLKLIIYELEDSIKNIDFN